MCEGRTNLGLCLDSGHKSPGHSRDQLFAIVKFDDECLLTI